MASLPRGAFEFKGQLRQDEEADAAAGYFPSRHCSHGELPLSGLASPAAQGWQGPPSGPLYPTLQMQSVRDSL